MSKFTDKRYIEKFQEAQQRSSKIGLQHNNLKLDAELYDTKAIIDIARFSIGLMKAMGMHSTAEARSKCMTVHHAIQQELSVAGISSELTIGNVVLRDKPFIDGVTLQSLISEISSPKYDQPQDIHCWLTLRDGSILDFTVYSSLTSPEKPEPIEENYVYIEPYEHDPKHYYEPMLVGNEYLELTGAVETVFLAEQMP